MLPNLIVIGAMKCGTTSLHRYLGLHPAVFMSETKEVNFFLAEGTWERGTAWYASLFPDDRPVRGESSPSYAHHPYFEGVPERMRSVVPDAKLVYLVRDPFERIVSHWIHDVAEGREGRDLGACLEDLATSGYVAASSYFAQLERYLAWYPLDRVLVLRLEDLAHARAPTLAKAFRFLGVDDSFRSVQFARVEHRSSEKRLPTHLGRRLAASALGQTVASLPGPLGRRVRRVLERPFSRPVERPSDTTALRRRVRAYLHADGARLARLTGMDLSAWYD